MTVTEDYHRRVWEGAIQPDAAQIAVLPQLDALRAALAAPRPWFGRRGPVKGLYLWGAVGRGKSLLINLLLARVPGGRRVHFHAFLLELHAAIHAATRAGQRDPIGATLEHVGKGLRLLALDEMDVSDIADAMLVDRVFRSLIARGVTVVTTSNRPPSGLYRDGLKRDLFLPFIGMLERELTVLRLDSPTDWRRSVPPGERIRFLQGDPGFDLMWDRVAEGGEVPLALEVLGRSLTLPRCSGRALRADFAELCIAPLGPADHRAIAQAFDLVFLDGIPANLVADTLRRLVLLIDELYEAGGTLITRSEAPVDEVLSTHPAGLRAASRLNEMAGTGWGRGGIAEMTAADRRRPPNAPRRSSGPIDF